MFANAARACLPACFAAALVATYRRALHPKKRPAGCRPKPVVEVAFVLDTTGSMGPLIEGAKRKIWSIATAILDANPDAEIRMGLVAYRDIGDDYVTKKFDLTTDIQDLYANLLELQARGGGDWPESVNEALEVGGHQAALDAGADTCRIMFLVGDAPPHMDYAQDTKYPDVIRMAVDRGIIVNAVQAGDARDTVRVWREIAQMGNGRYIPIPQDGGRLVIIETPYDTEIIELQGRINGTVIPYGSRAAAIQRRAEDPASRAAPAPAAPTWRATSTGAVHAIGEAVTGRGDLVADVATAASSSTRQGRRAAGHASRHEAGRAASLIDKNAAERKTLNERMAELVKQRDGYVEQQRNNAPRRPADLFDRAVAETLAVQIKR